MPLAQEIEDTTEDIPVFIFASVAVNNISDEALDKLGMCQ